MDEEDPIVYGIRDERFTDLIKGVLKNAGVKDKYINKIINKNTMKIFDMAFTSKTADPVNNYEFLEILGDSTLGKFIVWYYAKRFPQLNCAEGVDILARLKITYGAKIMVSRLTRRMGFDMSFVTIRESKITEVTKTLEDVGEAFIGAVESIFDQNYPLGVGYNVVYDMLQYYMDSETISLKYEDLYDPKTRLYQLADYIEKKFGVRKPTIKFDNFKKTDNDYIVGEVYVKTEDKNFNIKYGLTKPVPIPRGFNRSRVSQLIEYIKSNIRKPSIKLENFRKVSNQYIVGDISVKIEDFENYSELSEPVGSGRARTKKEVEQQAAKQALEYFAKRGIEKGVPEVYTRFCEDFPFDLDLKIE